jgi:SRSO17 transposase
VIRKGANLEKTENGIVSTKIYGVVNGITHPLMFKFFKLRGCLKEENKYKKKLQLTVEIRQELKALGFTIGIMNYFRSPPAVYEATC